MGGDDCVLGGREQGRGSRMNLFRLSLGSGPRGLV